MSNEKAMIILLKVGLIKKILVFKMSYFPEPYKRSRNKIKVELYLSNYAAKSDLKSTTGVDTLKFAKKTDLTSLKSDIGKVGINDLEKVPIGLNSLKSEVDKLDVDKLKLASLDFKKISDVVEKEVAKKTAYDELVKKVNAIITNGRVKKTDYDHKITDIEGKISSITDLATIVALNAVEKKIPNNSNLDQKHIMVQKYQIYKNI